MTEKLRGIFFFVFKAMDFDIIYAFQKMLSIFDFLGMKSSFSEFDLCFVVPEWNFIKNDFIRY